MQYYSSRLFGETNFDSADVTVFLLENGRCDCKTLTVFCVQLCVRNCYQSANSHVYNEEIQNRLLMTMANYGRRNLTSAEHSEYVPTPFQIQRRKPGCSNLTLKQPGTDAKNPPLKVLPQCIVGSPSQELPLDPPHAHQILEQ